MCLHPRDRLPPEMWAAIFHHLTAPLDLYNVMEAHPFWDELLQLQLPDIQFKLVFPLLVHVIDQRRRADKSSSHRRIPYLSTNNTLNCRLVCKSWNEAVRDYYQGPLYHAFESLRRSPFIDGRNLTRNQFFGVGFNRNQVIFPTIHIDPRHSIFGRINPGGYRGWLQSTLISHPPQTGANPFLSKEWGNCNRMAMDGAAVENDAEIRDTLRAYGSHLRRLRLDWKSSTPVQTFYLTMKDWLTLTPNVTSLKVSLEEGWGAVLILQEEVAALENLIREHPLPPLLYLESLVMDTLPNPVGKAFLERYHSVKDISIWPRIRNWKEEGPQSALAPLENYLQTLQLTIRREDNLLILGRDHHPSWLHLQHLEVNFQSSALSWERIISLLNQNFGHAPKLANLLLCLPRYESDQMAALLRDTQRSRLQLRSVKQLKLRLNNSNILGDFLLPMKNSLQKVAIEFMFQGAKQGDFPPNARVGLQEKVLWNGYFGKKLLESNLWSIFHKLNFLRIESYKGWTYRRIMGIPVMINPDGTEETMDEDEYEN